MAIPWQQPCRAAEGVKDKPGGQQEAVFRARLPQNRVQQRDDGQKQGQKDDRIQLHPMLPPFVTDSLLLPLRDGDSSS